jgi:hypothetical protein
MAAKQTKTAAPGPISATAWAERKGHLVTLSSGAQVKIEIPDLPELVKSGNIPNDLVETAISVAQGTPNLTREHIEQQPELYRFIVKTSVVEPKVDDELYSQIPYEDKELIVEIATRQRDVDAVGDHIGGLHTNKKWRKFRGLDFGDTDLEGLQGS